jgi:hypothetical protein
MARYFIYCLFAIIYLFPLRTLKAEENVKKVFEDTKKAGRLVPVSVGAKQAIDEATETPAEESGQHIEPSVSLDCKSWQLSKDFFRSTEEKKIRLKDLFSKDENSIGRIDEDKQSILLAGEAVGVTYVKVLNHAIIALMADRALVYRTVNRDKIRTDIVGLMQGLVLLGAQRHEQWQFSLQKNGKLVLLYLFPDTMKSAELKHYLGARCTTKDKCELIGRKTASKRLTLLSVGSVEHVVMASAGLFSQNQIMIYNEACAAISEKTFFSEYRHSLDTLKSKCMSTNFKAEPNFENLIAACREWESSIRPLLQSFEKQ